MLSQTAEHALRALLYLARHPDGPVPADAVADAIGAPRNYLAKTLHALAKRGIVSGVRGPNGGFQLEVSPERLAVAQVIEAFDGTGAGRGMCLLGGRACSGAEPCCAHERWAAVWRESLAPLRRTTLADLLRPAEVGRTEDARTEGPHLPLPNQGIR